VNPQSTAAVFIGATEGPRTLSAVPSRDRLALSLLALTLVVWCAAAVSYWSVYHDAVGPDSVTYLDAARSLAQGNGYAHRWAYWDPVYTDGTLPTRSSMWPAGLSLAIAAGITVGLDAITAGRSVVLCSFLGTALLLFLWGRRWLPGTAALMAAFVAVAPAPHPTPDAAYIVSELPFLLSATAAALCTVRALAGGDRASLWWALGSTTASIAFLMRYVGLGAVAAVGCLALVAWVSRRATWKSLIASAAPGMIIVGVTLVRNQMVSGHFGQPWPGADIFWPTFPGAAKSILSALARADEFAGVLRLTVLLKLTAVAILCGYAVGHLFSAIRNAPRATWFDRLAPTVVLLCFGVFVGGLTVAATAMNGMNLEPRYMTVLAPWALACVSAWALSATPARRRWLPWTACAVWIFTEAGAAAISAGRPAANYVSQGATSQAIQWAQAHATSSETLLTNRGADLAFWTPNPVLRLPRLPHSAGGTHSIAGIDQLADRFGARYFVYFRGYPVDAKYNREEFVFVRQFDNPGVFGDRVVAEFPDAIVYRVGNRSAESVRAAHQEAP
jgi:hypothetical protein